MEAQSRATPWWRSNGVNRQRNEDTRQRLLFQGQQLQDGMRRWGRNKTIESQFEIISSPSVTDSEEMDVEDTIADYAYKNGSVCVKAAQYKGTA